VVRAERPGHRCGAARRRGRHWPLASTIVIDGLAIGEIIEPRGSPSLAGQFEGMPPGHAWNQPQPHLISAAVALPAGQLESSSAALDVAEGVLWRLPADQEVACRLAAAMIRLAASRRTGDFMAAAAAAARAEMLVSRVPDDKLAVHRQIRRVCCPVAELSSCGRVISTRRPAPSARVRRPRPLPVRSTNEPTALGFRRWPRLCAAG